MKDRTPEEFEASFKKETFDKLKVEAVNIYKSRNKTLEEMEFIISQWDLDGDEFNEIMSELHSIK